MNTDALFQATLISCAKFVGAGLATIGLGGAAIGIGVVFAGFLNAVARSPFYTDELFRYALLGFALAEATGLMALMMAFLILYS